MSSSLLLQVEWFTSHDFWSELEVEKHNNIAHKYIWIENRSIQWSIFACSLPLSIQSDSMTFDVITTAIDIDAPWPFIHTHTQTQHIFSTNLSWIYHNSRTVHRYTNIHRRLKTERNSSECLRTLSHENSFGFFASWMVLKVSVNQFWFRMNGKNAEIMPTLNAEGGRVWWK